MNEWGGAQNPVLFQNTVDDLFLQVSKVDRDDRFLEVYFQHLKTKGAQSLPASIQIDLAKRLVENGFSSSARDLLTQNIPDSDAKRIVLAKAALTERDAPAALTHLSEIKTTEAEALRGQAYMMLGRYTEAEASFAQAKQDQMALNAAWLGGDWESVMTDGTAKQKNFVEKYPLRIPSGDIETARSDGLLTKSRRLLSDSKEARNALKAVLADENPG